MPATPPDAQPGAATPPDATLPARLRLKTQRQFRAVYQRGGRAAGAWLTVVAWPRHDPTPGGPRVGLSVSKDHGGAVRRNKLKRVLREAFRLERHRLPQQLDVVLIPKVRLDDRLPLAAVRDELLQLIPKALSRPPRRRPPQQRAK